MFKRIAPIKHPLNFTFDGVAVSGQDGDNIAAALLAAGHTVLRQSPVSKCERAPLCMMGVCFECLVTIEDGVTVQACLTRLEEGMNIRSPSLQSLSIHLKTEQG